MVAHLHTDTMAEYIISKEWIGETTNVKSLLRSYVRLHATYMVGIPPTTDYILAK